jgi:hypothetical protein
VTPAAAAAECKSELLVRELVSRGVLMAGAWAWARVAVTAGLGLSGVRLECSRSIRITRRLSRSPMSWSWSGLSSACPSSPTMSGGLGFFFLLRLGAGRAGPLQGCGLADVVGEPSARPLSLGGCVGVREFVRVVRQGQRVEEGGVYASFP